LSFLIDTNVLSELSRQQPEARVELWFLEVPDDATFVSAATWAELRFGIERLPPGRRRDSIGTWLETVVIPRFGHQTLAVDLAIGERWGRIVADAERKGITVETNDGFIASTALVHDLTIVTRNTKDFEPLGVKTFNPWAA
jgi:toxin FitB